MNDYSWGEEDDDKYAHGRQLERNRRIFLGILVVILLVVAGYFFVNSGVFGPKLIGKWERGIDTLEFYHGGSVEIYGPLLGIHVTCTGNYEVIDRNHVHIECWALGGLFHFNQVMEFKVQGNILTLDGVEYSRVR